MNFVCVLNRLLQKRNAAYMRKHESAEEDEDDEEEQNTIETSFITNFVTI